MLLPFTGTKRSEIEEKILALASKEHEATEAREAEWHRWAQIEHDLRMELLRKQLGEIFKNAFKFSILLSQ